jgi:signal transduction histidine kinase
MTIEMRKTGVDVVGDIPWGTHFCLFYETKADLLETSVSYCKAGLEGQEFCLWVVAEPLAVEEARRALKRALPDFGRYYADHSIEIVAARDWYLQDGTFDLNRIIGGWNEKVARALARGYVGIRVTGDTAWLEKKDWKDFCEYEDSVNQAIANQRLAALCTYPLAACGAAEILDVVRTHQFTVAKRRGTWEVIETAGHKQAKAEIKRLNEELEQRVVERTTQLTAVNNELTKEVLERQRAEEALLRSEAYLAEAQSVSHTGSFGWDISSGRIFWSEETFRIFEYDRTIQPAVELILRRTHPQDRELVQEIIDRASETRADFAFEHRLLMPDGSVKHIHVTARAMQASSGNLEFVGAVTDVTAAKRAEEALRSSEREQRHIAAQLERERARLVEAQEVAKMGSWEAELQTLNVIWSEQTHRIFETDPSRFHPTRPKFREFIHPEDRAKVDAAFVASLDKRSPSTVEYRIVMPDGRVKILEERWQGFRDEEGKPVRVAGTCRDITEAVRAEEELRRLSGQLLRLQDEERRRIARDLHDSTGQNLVALATILSQLHASIPSSARKLRKLASECQELADRCIREVRTLSYLLHPPMLDEAGLDDAIRHYVDGFSERTGIEVKSQISPLFGRMPPDVELALFRVVQESLTNIQRHSQSLRATIQLDRTADEVKLEISDKGAGASRRELTGGPGSPFRLGVGIPSMHERVRLIGGWLEIESSSSGTTVRVTVPVDGQRHEETSHPGGG